MEIKGISVKSPADFIKEKFPDSYNEWLEKLPDFAFQNDTLRLCCIFTTANCLYH